MRRATVLRGHGLGAAVYDVAFTQLLKTPPLATATRTPSLATLNNARRVSSSFNANPKLSPSSITRTVNIKLLGRSHLGLSSPWRPAIAQLRPFNSTSHLRDTPKETDRQDLIEKEKARREEEEEDLLDEQGGFHRSEKASKAAPVNLSARLSSPKAQGNTAGF